MVVIFLSAAILSRMVFHGLDSVSRLRILDVDTWEITFSLSEYSASTTTRPVDWANAHTPIKQERNIDNPMFLKLKMFGFIYKIIKVVRLNDLCSYIEKGRPYWAAIA